MATTCSHVHLVASGHARAVVAALPPRRRNAPRRAGLALAERARSPHTPPAQRSSVVMLTTEVDAWIAARNQANVAVMWMFGMSRRASSWGHAYPSHRARDV